jgi:hypothetical protein
VCYELKVLRKLCVLVDLSFMYELPAEDAEIVTDVHLNGGCFPNGSIALYKTINAEVKEDESRLLKYERVALEVRSAEDPYVVFTQVDRKDSADLSIFFWLSIFCLFGAILSILMLGYYYKLYIEEKDMPDGSQPSHRQVPLDKDLEE